MYNQDDNISHIQDRAVWLHKYKANRNLTYIRDAYRQFCDNHPSPNKVEYRHHTQGEK